MLTLTDELIVCFIGSFTTGLGIKSILNWVYEKLQNYRHREKINVYIRLLPEFVIQALDIGSPIEVQTLTDLFIRKEWKGLEYILAYLIYLNNISKKQKIEKVLGKEVVSEWLKKYARLQERK